MPPHLLQAVKVVRVFQAMALILTLEPAQHVPLVNLVLVAPQYAQTVLVQVTAQVILPLTAFLVHQINILQVLVQIHQIHV